MGDYKKGGICLLIGSLLMAAGVYLGVLSFYAIIRGDSTNLFIICASFVIVLVGLVFMGIGGAFLRRGFWGRPEPER